MVEVVRAGLQERGRRRKEEGRKVRGGGGEEV